jgi:hypothetical protein
MPESTPTYTLPNLLQPKPIRVDADQRGRPVAVCVSEALARQAAEREFSRGGRPLRAEWTRPTNRGDIVAVLRST